MTARTCAGKPHYLWVGTECIIHHIPITHRGTEIVGEAAKSAHVHRLVADIKTGARLQRAYALLNELAAADSRFRDTHWKATWRTGYSVKQLQLIAVRARALELPFTAANFKINTRRPDALPALEALQWWQYRQLRPALTPART